MNLQYGSYKNTKHVLQVVHLEQKEKLKFQLPSQGFIISFLLDHSLLTLNSLWSSTQSKPPKNICKFTVRYLNNMLVYRTNLHKWKLSLSPDYSVCLHPESLLHVVAGCKYYLEDGRYTWTHNSALHFVASTLRCTKNYNLYVDPPGFLSPCNLTGDLRRMRTCRRLSRNTGWLENLRQSYSNDHLKKTFRVSKETFSFILLKIRCKLERQTTAEEPISPECHLGKTFIQLCS